MSVSGSMGLPGSSCDKVGLLNPGGIDGVEVSFTMKVVDYQVLWAAARDRLLSFELSIEEVEECIGPRLDVALSDCLLALLFPLDVPGCIVCNACATAAR